LVIFPDAPRVVADAGPLIAALLENGVAAHIAGVTSSPDRLFSDDSVAISGIYRAKGNEAPMVYLLNSDHCYEGYRLPTKRNTLFTAITRSRAWVRICGVGGRMKKLQEEIGAIASHKYRLEFRLPTDDQLKQLRRIHRDMTQEEKRRLASSTENL